MHKLSSRLLVLSCACLILFSVLSFSFSAADVTATLTDGSASFFTTKVSLVTYNGFSSQSSFTITLSAPIDYWPYYIAGNGSIQVKRSDGTVAQTIPVNSSGSVTSGSVSVLSFVVIPSEGSSITFAIDSSQVDIVVPETAPPEYSDALSMMTSGFSTVSGIWQGVIDLVSSNWLLVVGLVCFIAVFAISSIRKNYRS